MTRQSRTKRVLQARPITGAGAIVRWEMDLECGHKVTRSEATPFAACEAKECRNLAPVESLHALATRP